MSTRQGRGADHIRVKLVNLSEMLDATRLERLRALRSREGGGVLTAEERAELDAIFAVLDAEEAAALAPALARSRQRQAEMLEEQRLLEAQAKQLEQIVAAQTALLDGARTFLDELRVRRAKLASRYRKATGSELLPRDDN